MNELILEHVKRSNDQYQSMRDRHYVENRGTHGQQIHFNVYVDGHHAGIISGASAVYTVKDRDEFFGIPSSGDGDVTLNGETVDAATARQKYYLSAIINNNVFRLERDKLPDDPDAGDHGAYPNLGTQILSVWREAVAYLWEEIYEIPIIGFETFIIENPDTGRDGSMYEADNWTLVGKTQGNTKQRPDGLGGQQERRETERKLIYCKWRDNTRTTPTTRYQSTWRKETDEEKQRAKRRENRRDALLGIRVKEMITG